MDYLDAVIQLLREVKEKENSTIEQAAYVLADAIQADHLVYVFGASHAGILSQELFYRAGGLVPVNPIFPPGLMVNVRPVTLTTRLERLTGLAAQILAETPLQVGDILIVHSVSGRNAAAVELAQGARARGVYVIALTSVGYSQATTPRQPGMPRLMEVADLVLDNHAPVGDALVEVPGFPTRVAPVSTITGAAILNTVVARAVALLVKRTGDAPVFVSANLDGGEERNQHWLDHYRSRLTYL